MRRSTIVLLLSVATLLLAACGAAPEPTPYPTYTPYPSQPHTPPTPRIQSRSQPCLI